MILRQNDKGSQLFTLRVWPEEISTGHTEWRGKIQHVVDGEALYFHGWEAMMTFLVKTLEPNLTGVVTPGDHDEEVVK